MKKIVYFISILLIAINVNAQQNDFSYKVHTPKTKYKAITVNPSTVQVDYNPSIQNIEAPKPGTRNGRAHLQFLKETMPEFKTTGKEITSFNAPAPTLGRSISANEFNNRVPNDNDMAISNDGKIISVINSTIFVYDLASNTNTLTISLEAFTDTTGPDGDSLNIVGSKFDPKVLYDPDSDRFIILYLNGSTFATSKIIVGFSQTNDPAAAWNLYALEGNPLNDSTWSDYPFIAINNNDLFISINTFFNGSQNNSGFAQSTFWQIDKEDGYTGNPLTTAYYHDIEFNGANIFNTTPVRGGSGNYGPQMYLVSNFAQAQTSKSFFLLTVSDRVKGSPVLNIDHIESNLRYALPPNARQIPRNGNQLSLFDTNDNRILGAFFENNSIQFVMNTRVPSSNICGIYHGFIDFISTDIEVTGNILSDTLDIGFPNITYTGKSALENEAIINCNHSGPFTGAGNSVFFYDNNGNYSPMTFVKQSDFYIDVIIGSGVERWGDYTGAQRKYNEPGVMWYCGYDALEISPASKRGTPNTWISEIQSPTANIRPQEFFSGQQISDVVTFPNPSLNQDFKVEFLIETDMNLDFYLVDNKGAIITLLSERVKAGKNLFTFSTTDLAKGQYHLLINNGSNTIFNEKIIKL